MQDGDKGILGSHPGWQKRNIKTQDFSVETDKEGRFRLWFRNRLTPQVTDGDWIGVTLSARSFLQMADTLHSMLQEMMGEE